MAKNDNLKDFCTNIADAIREKKGTTELINPQNFADEILSIEGGGDAPIVESKDVNFYDYDGTLLYSYTLAEAQALTELPPLPTQEGLICQGWNWDYEDVVALDFPMNIGATYITDDGKTRFVIDIDRNLGMDFYLSIGLAADSYATIDWGDGSEPESYGTGGVIWDTRSWHTYAQEGRYVVSVEFTGTCYLWRSADTTKFSSAFIKEIYYGENVASVVDAGGANQRFCSVIKMTMPYGIPYSDYALQATYALPCVVIPKPRKGYYAGAGYNRRIVCVPKTIESMYCASHMGMLTDVNAMLLSAISNRQYNSCFSMHTLRFSPSLTSIGIQAFAYNDHMALYDFSRCLQVPTLASYNAFDRIPTNCKIVVPDALYDTWIASTNWATYADYIVKSSEYNA